MSNLISLVPLEPPANISVLYTVFCLLGLFFLYHIIKGLEVIYVLKNKKPFYVHFYWFKKKLTAEQKFILYNDFHFFNKLSEKEKVYFEHRVASFIQDKQFIGKESIEVSDEMKVLISATAVMLTFGFRNYYIGLIRRIIIFPDVFYSQVNDDYHQGEFNPALQTLVLSWKDFQRGYDILNDKLNLGIHEFTHAIHLNSIKERDISSNVFQDGYKELVRILSSNEQMRADLIASRFFRDYAYTNQFEFIAVIVETFIETPNELNQHFPEIYNKVRQMLNFNFAGY